MAAAPNLPFEILNNKGRHQRDSRDIVLGGGANELVFGVVGHAGAGTSTVADTLAKLLQQTKVGQDTFEVELIVAQTVIREWAKERNKPFPPVAEKPTLHQVQELQDLGDAMRAEETEGGVADHSAVARRMILKIRAQRGEKTHQAVEGGKPVKPDGKHRVYILDSLRHPAEVALLRHIYQDAFILIGVVCEEEKRIERLGKKCKDAGRENALEFMRRDADADEKHGQHVADTFHLSDFFVDHSMDRTNRDGSSNRLWEINDHLMRLLRILTHSSLERPTIAETAMHHASSAQLRSACLSRQVGAALVDSGGNIVATGTNEAPRAGGGVYGEQFRDHEEEEKAELDYRCAYFEKSSDRYCRNSRTQLEIIRHLIADIPVLAKVPPAEQPALIESLRKTELGALIEFSRAVHAEMDALLTAARKGVSIVGTRLFVTTFPCHYCARHLVAAGVDEVQFIEAYPKSRAISLHRDAIELEGIDWKAPSKGGTKVLIHPFSGVAPRLYKRAFTKDRELKDKLTGEMRVQEPDWGTPWHLRSVGYPEMEAALSEETASTKEKAGEE